MMFTLLGLLNMDELYHGFALVNYFYAIVTNCYICLASGFALSLAVTLMVRVQV